MLETLEKVSHQIDVEVEEGLFEGADNPLTPLAEKLAGVILAEPGLPLKGIRVAKADLPEEDQDEEFPEIGFYLKLACGPKEAFKWLERLSYRQADLADSLTGQERRLFNSTFAVVPKWERRQ